MANTNFIKPDPISYDKAFDYLMMWEDSHPVSGKVTDDAGGITKYGISSHAYPHLPVEDLTLEQAKDIYLKDYWEARWESPSSYNQTLANKHFQMKVNLGATGYIELMDCLSYVASNKIYDFTSLCIAQLVHYKERYGTLTKIPAGLRNRALG